ncbi:hypothetical protein AD928_03680 [Acetobacter cerevisiae]|uniref:Uncharacterized protein n=2 Tax=Acetobacter cerevisiae TaxID=178900 RepID=A0A149QJP4_9PROT|nr:hypothetical protein AD928_03680 [Acetobacter cerevisiae]
MLPFTFRGTLSNRARNKTFCSEVLKVALLIQTRDYHSSDYLGQRLAEDFRLRASLKGLSPVGN